eukprot:GEMP01072471.1.p1 GENE.GEMP01072471.1~~GEMP01072471.1.p1  ORF type:complete len:253 (+),score=45.22 GEMP01072471.1:95-853(+)
MVYFPNLLLHADHHIGIPDSTTHTSYGHANLFADAVTGQQLHGGHDTCFVARKAKWPLKCGANAQDSAKRLDKMKDLIFEALNSQVPPKAGVPSQTNPGMAGDPKRLSALSPEAQGGERTTHDGGVEIPHVVLNPRTELKLEGPVPLLNRVAELNTHAYYLWGLSKAMVSRVAGSTSDSQLAGNVEDAAFATRWAAARMARAYAQEDGKNHMFFQSSPPYLPMVREGLMPWPLLLWTPCTKSDDAAKTNEFI